MSRPPKPCPECDGEGYVNTPDDGGGRCGDPECCPPPSGIIPCEACGGDPETADDAEPVYGSGRAPD